MSPRIQFQNLFVVRFVAAPVAENSLLHLTCSCLSGCVWCFLNWKINFRDLYDSNNLTYLSHFWDVIVKLFELVFVLNEERQDRTSVDNIKKWVQISSLKISNYKFLKENFEPKSEPLSSIGAMHQIKNAIFPIKYIGNQLNTTSTKNSDTEKQL